MHIHWIEICYLKALNAYLPCSTWSIATIKFNFLPPNPYSQSYGFSSSQVWMWELDHKKKGWAPNNQCFWMVVCEKTLESPLDCKEIQPVHPKGDQSWIFIGRTDVEAETPKLWPPNAKSQLIGKNPDAGKDWGQEEKGVTEDEMVGWHHWLNGVEFEQSQEMVEDREAWGVAVHGVTKSWRWLSDGTTTSWSWPKCRFLY